MPGLRENPEEGDTMSISDPGQILEPIDLRHTRRAITMVNWKFTY